MINKKPYIEVKSNETSCWENWIEIGAEIKRKISTLNKKKVVVSVECYQGTYADINLDALKVVLSPNVTCHAKDIYKDESEIRQLAKKDLSKQMLAAKITSSSIEDYFDENKLEALRNNIAFIEEGVILIHGIGSHKIWEPDIIVYSDMSRWEILQRIRRNDISNIGVDNQQDEFKLQYLWSYFIDWRICDKIKKKLLHQCDYFLETNNWQKPKLATGNIVRKGLEMATAQPFFMAPFFDPELWDNKIQESNEEDDFSLAFNCNAEENNLLLKFSDKLFEIPAINLIYFRPAEFLGERVFKKFGSYLPIKFDFIDSTEGRNLILDIYPGADFLMDSFGMNYQQNNNYYVMSADPKAYLYLGLKEGVAGTYFKEILISNKKTKIKEIAQSLNKVPLSRHDHIFIPSETIHSKGQKCIILKVSTAPSIFQYQIFKQKGAKRRELHPQTDNLIDITLHRHQRLPEKNQVETITSRASEEKILDPVENQQIVLSRMWLEEPLHIEKNSSISVYNLIEGSKIRIESPNNTFSPQEIHYSETFIIPASLKSFRIVPLNNEKVSLLKAGAKI